MKKIIFAASLLTIAATSSAFATAPKLKGTYLITGAMVCQDSLSSGAPAIGGVIRQLVGTVSMGTYSGNSAKWTIKGQNAVGTLVSEAADFQLQSTSFGVTATITGTSNPYAFKASGGATGFVYLTGVSSGVAAKAFVAFHNGKCLNTFTLER